MLTEGWTGGRGKFRGEDQEGFVCAAKIAGEEVGEDGAGCVDGGGVGVIIRIPVVFEVREGFRGGGSTED